MTLATNIPGNRWDLIEQNTIVPDMKVSVIIPCTHDKNTLGVVLKSVFYQTYPQNLIEIIIVCPQDLAFDNIPANAQIVIADKSATDLRHAGALSATGEILLFIDDDTILDTECIYNHAAWHHRINNGFTIGNLKFISPYAVVESDLPNILYDLKNNQSDLKIMDSFRDQYLTRTRNLTDSYNEDIFSYTNINHMAIRTDNYYKVGGISANDIPRRVLGYEFGFRVYQHGCIFIPLQSISGWRLGRHDIVDNLVAKHKSLPIQQYIAHDLYRPKLPGASYKVPKYVVHLEIRSAVIALKIIEDILSHQPYDLVICINVLPDISQQQYQVFQKTILFNFRYDRRIYFNVPNALNAYPVSPFHIYINTVQPLRQAIIPFLIKNLIKYDLVQAMTTDQQSNVFIVRTRYLHRKYDFSHDLDQIAKIKNIPFKKIRLRKISINSLLSDKFKTVNNIRDLQSVLRLISQKSYAILKNTFCSPRNILPIIKILAKFNIGEISQLLIYLSHLRESDLLYTGYQQKLCSHRYKFIYIRTPKVASSSIQSVLKKIDPTLVSYNMTLDEVYTHFPETKQYFVFAFMRHPLSKLISCWRNKIMLPTENRGINTYASHYYGLYEHMSFVAFCEWLCSAWGADKLADSHWISQHKFFTSSYKAAPDFIGKYENLDADWQKLTEILGLPYIELPIYNKSKNARPNVDLPANLLSKIYQRYQYDYEIGQYNR